MKGLRLARSEVVTASPEVTRSIFRMFVERTDISLSTDVTYAIAKSPDCVSLLYFDFESHTFGTK